MTNIPIFDFLRDNWHVVVIIFSFGGYAVILMILREHTKVLFKRTDDIDVIRDKSREAHNIAMANKERMGLIEKDGAVLENRLTNITETIKDTHRLVLSLVNNMRNGTRRDDKEDN